MIAEVADIFEREAGTGVVCHTGIVLSVSEEGIFVESGGEVHGVVRSPGCLLDPAKGDTVLFLKTETLGVIVSVLVAKRPGEARTMTFPGGVSFRSDGEIKMEALRFNGTFSEFSVGAPLVTLTGDLLTFAGRKISEVAQTLERMAEWLHDRAKNATRQVAGVDRQQAGSVLIEAESLVSVASRSTLLSATDLVKIDSDQVHLG